MVHPIRWDASTNLPIVDGKIQRLETGAVEQAGIAGTFGPPAIDLVWWNKTPTPRFKGSRGPCFLRLNDLLTNIAALFNIVGGDIRLVTITASAYYTFVLCESSKLTLTMDDIWEFCNGRIGVDKLEYTKTEAAGAHKDVEHSIIDQSGERGRGSSISAIWHNMRITSDFRTVERAIVSGPEGLYIKVGEHIRNGLYDVISLNVSSSSLIVACETDCSLERFLEALSGEGL